MTLQQEIETKSRQIRTDSYPMSVGELINLYRDNEIDVHPEFQRIYRWTDTQKTRLIESLLLGIPLPPLFVAQRMDGVWDVVDGVQRLSTILQFVGLLKDDGGSPVEPLVLQKTKYLPSLEGKVWKDSEDDSRSFTHDQQLYIKRVKIDINIVLKESDSETKYELFMRLNTGGTPLSPQEVRNCLLVMAHPEAYQWLRSLSEYEPFQEAIALSDRSTEEQYHMELALRFLIFRQMPDSDLAKVSDIGDFLNEELARISILTRSQRKIEEEAFQGTFKLLADTVGDSAFHRFDTTKARFMGGFSISAFEVVALGIGFHYDSESKRKITKIEEKIKKLWSKKKFVNNSGSGIRASQARIPKIVPLGRTIFSP